MGNSGQHLQNIMIPVSMAGGMALQPTAIQSQQKPKRWNQGKRALDISFIFTTSRVCQVKDIVEKILVCSLTFSWEFYKFWFDVSLLIEFILLSNTNISK